MTPSFITGTSLSLYLFIKFFYFFRLFFFTVFLMVLLVLSSHCLVLMSYSVKIHRFIYTLISGVFSSFFPYVISFMAFFLSTYKKLKLPIILESLVLSSYFVWVLYSFWWGFVYSISLTYFWYYLVLISQVSLL